MRYVTGRRGLSARFLARCNARTSRRTPFCSSWRANTRAAGASGQIEVAGCAVRARALHARADRASTRNVPDRAVRKSCNLACKVALEHGPDCGTSPRAAVPARPARSTYSIGDIAARFPMCWGIALRRDEPRIPPRAAQTAIAHGLLHRYTGSCEPALAAAVQAATALRCEREWCSRCAFRVRAVDSSGWLSRVGRIAGSRWGRSGSVGER
jgi:hypothetical protein